MNTTVNVLDIRLRWTTDQKNILRNYFKENIMRKKAPRKEECEAFVNKHETFAKIGWLKIKTFVFNEYRVKK